MSRVILPGVALAVGLLFAVRTSAILADNSPVIRVGTAKVDVTPRRPVVLAGYGGRTTEYEGVDTPLWARALVIGHDAPVAIVVLDNCGVPRPVVASVADRLQSLGIGRGRLVVAATHTHNAPTLVGYAPVVWAGRTTPEQERHVREYTEFVIDRMVTAVETALKTRIPMQLEWAQGRVTFGGNRRVLNNGQWAGFGFQRNGPVDHSLPVLAARDDDGQVRAIWANYACHCTTVGSRNRIGGDWAGFANESIEKAFPDAVSLMTIGCGADVGPQPSGRLQIAEKHGGTIAAEVSRLLAGATKPLVAAPKVANRRIRLPLDAPRSREYWDEQLRRGGFHGQLAKLMVQQLEKTGEVDDHVEYPISAWTFGDDLAMVFLAGEVVVDYSVRLGRELDWTKLWITGWANGMPGYIPSRRVLEEGGYEAEFSQVYYAQPGRYAPEVEDVLVAAVNSLLADRFSAPPNQQPAPFHRLPSREEETFRRVAAWAASKKPAAEQLILSSIRRVVNDAVVAVGRVADGSGEPTEWYNFVGDFAHRIFIRQESEGTSLKWRVPALQKRPNGPLTLCFTGGVGWISQPKTEGFSLSVAGMERLRFDVTLKSARWTSEDGAIDLLYLPIWTSAEDSGGFFFLRISSDDFEPGEPVTLEVRSAGAGSLRWFAIDSKQDVAARLKKLGAALGTDP